MAKPNKAFSELASAVYQKDEAKVGKLLAKVKADAQPYNAYGDSLLMSAINNGAKLSLVKLLVEQGGASLDWKSRQGETPITVAQQRDRADVIEYFASRGAKCKYVPLDKLPQKEKDTRLARAIEDWTDDDLAKNVGTLLDAGADPNVTIGGRPALHFLSGHGANAPKVFEKLIAAGADPAAVDKQGDTALHVLAEGADDTADAKVLLAKVSIEIRDRAGRTPLHRAAASDYWDAPKFVKFLIDRGADLNAIDKDGKRPVDLASGDTKKLLLKLSVKPVSKDSLALIKAVESDNASAVKKLLAGGADPCAVDTSGKEYGPNSLDGLSALHLAFTRGVSRAVADLVLAHGTLDVNVRSTDGRTPLHYLICYGEGRDRVELVERLLALGADPDAANDSGETPIWETISFYELDGEPELIDMLVAAGAKLGHEDEGGETVLDAMFAKTERFHEQNDKAGFARVLQHLVERKAPTSHAKHIKSWLETKGAKYLTKAKPAPKQPSVARKQLASIANGALATYVGKNTHLVLGKTKQPVALFDWFVYCDQQDADKHRRIDELLEYHVPAKAKKHVDAERWIPFGIVGMTGSFDSYKDVGVEGTLFVDLSKAKGGDAPVVFTTMEYLGLSPAKPLVVPATSYGKLMKTLTVK